MVDTAHEYHGVGALGSLVDFVPLSAGKLRVGPLPLYAQGAVAALAPVDDAEAEHLSFAQIEVGGCHRFEKFPGDSDRGAGPFVVVYEGQTAPGGEAEGIFAVDRRHEFHFEAGFAEFLGCQGRCGRLHLPHEIDTSYGIGGCGRAAPFGEILGGKPFGAWRNFGLNGAVSAQIIE